MAKIHLVHVRGAFRNIMELQQRERKYLISEIAQVKGLMPLLMKPRNKQRWNAEDKAELRAHLSRLSHISPYIAVMILPGSIVLLPALAWWLDRRRKGAPELRSKFTGESGAAPPAPTPAIGLSPQAPARTD